jgi:hypothetical protein
LQLNSNNTNGEKSDQNIIPDNDGFKTIVENFFKQMTELNNITALGPFTSVMNDPNINLNSLKEHGNLLIKYQTNLNLYLSSMINAYFAALNKISTSSKEEKISSIDYRKIIINSFEDVFSSMFQSHEFSITYNNLANSIIDLIKSYQSFFDTNPLLFSRSQQILTKEEKDSLFYNLHEIKKLSLEIKKKLTEKNNE